MDKSTEDNAQEISVIVWHNMTLFVRPAIGNIALQLHYMQYPRVRVSEVYSGQIKL